MRDHAGGSTYRLGFDQLVLATGARPRRPDVPGVDAAGIHGVQTLDDGERLLDSLEHGPRRRWSWAAATSASRWPRRWSTAASRSRC